MEFRDATCPDVGIIAGKVRMHAKKGFRTVIFGDPQHPEVIGLLGYAEGQGHVISGPADIDALWTLLGSHDGLPRSLCSHLQGDDPAASKTCGAIICDPTRSHILARRGCINGASYRVVEVEA